MVSYFFPPRIMFRKSELLSFCLPLMLPLLSPLSAGLEGELLVAVEVLGVVVVLDFPCMTRGIRFSWVRALPRG